MRVFKAVSVIIGLLLLAVALVAAAYGAITGSVFGLFDFDVILGFFAGVTAEQVVFGILVLLFWLIPDLGLRFYNFLKDAWKLEDEQAHDFLFAVSFGLAAVAMLVTGTLQLEGLDFTITNILAVGSSIWALSQVAYKRLFPQP